MPVTVVDGPSLPWVNGTDVFDSMEPAFRNGFGGTAEEVRHLLSKYWMRSLWVDPVTTRRIDHVRGGAGYVDLSEAYHDSVEEALLLGGEVTLTAEGHFLPGDYFWRPPGWVHKAISPLGFENILCMEGEVPSEGSGRVSRIVCGDHQGGEQVLTESPPDIGPRGYVRRAETRFQPWRSEVEHVVGLGECASAACAKPLSANAGTGACSLLVLLPAGAAGRLAVSDRERFLVTTAGDLTVDGRTVGACSLVHVPPGEAGPALSCEKSIELFVKVGEPR